MWATYEITPYTMSSTVIRPGSITEPPIIAVGFQNTVCVLRDREKIEVPISNMAPEHSSGVGMVQCCVENNIYGRKL